MSYKKKSIFAVVRSHSVNVNVSFTVQKWPIIGNRHFVIIVHPSHGDNSTKQRDKTETKFTNVTLHNSNKYETKRTKKACGIHRKTCYSGMWCAWSVQQKENTNNIMQAATNLKMNKMRLQNNYIENHS